VLRSSFFLGLINSNICSMNLLTFLDSCFIPSLLVEKTPIDKESSE
jgi:hypothetical protein